MTRGNGQGQQVGPRRGQGGGAPSPQTPSRRGPTLGRAWGPPGALLRRLESPLRLYIGHRPENHKYPIIFFRRRPRPPPSQALVREGSAALPGTLPDRGIDTGGIYTTMPASGVMRE